jgi:hypothetical protein
MTKVSLRRVAQMLALSIVGISADAAAAEWPPLPAQGFIKGRAAQKDDVAKGNAVFAAVVNGVVVGKPLPVSIPQYAQLRASHDRVIVVQAELANGFRLYGVRGLDGKNAVVAETDLELLGTKRPSN